MFVTLIYRDKPINFRQKPIRLSLEQMTTKLKAATSGVLPKGTQSIQVVIP